MKGSILIVDDEELERELLRQIFENDYNIIMASNGKEAINKLNKHFDSISIILLDLVMPVLNGYQVLQVLNSMNVFKDIPVAMVTSNSNSQMDIACYQMGAVAVVHKPFVAQVVRKRVDNIIELYQSSRQLRQTLKEQQQKLDVFYDNLIDAISGIVEFRDLESGMHIKRVKGLTRIMAENYMKMYQDSGLTSQKIGIIVRASAIHDIGKISIPDSILLKPGPLTDDERLVMMSHTTKGCEILGLLTNVQDSEHFQVSYDICRHHHERYDGKGYPDGLKGDEIPLSAQLVSIVDVYDALVSKRVYKQPFSKDTAYNMILNGECGVFAPNILECFKHTRDQIEAFSDSYR